MQHSGRASRYAATGVLGYEWDDEVDNGSGPAVSYHSRPPPWQSELSLFQSSSAPVSTTLGCHRHASLDHVPGSSGALVFGAGTIQWSWGLDATHDLSGTPADVNMQQATVNILADMGVSLQRCRRPGTAVASTDTTPPTSTISRLRRKHSKVGLSQYFGYRGGLRGRRRGSS